MTQTPNIGLKKIDGSENWRNVFDYHNDSMDLADEAIAGVRAGLTYVENGDTIAANANYTAGKFIAWKGEIYRVKTTINATVTSGNWTTYLDKMDGMGGALSQINGDLASLNSKIAWKLLYYNNGSTANALNLDLAKYTMLLFKNNYGESFFICQQANANGAYFATTSRFYTSSIPVVMFQYELKINNDATGIYIDQNESKQININSDGTIEIYPYTSEFDFVRVYGAQIQ